MMIGFCIFLTLNSFVGLSNMVRVLYYSELAGKTPY